MNGLKTVQELRDEGHAQEMQDHQALCDVGVSLDEFGVGPPLAYI